MGHIFRAAGCGAGLSLFTLAAAVSAQDAPPPPAPAAPSLPTATQSPGQTGLEEIVVTAQKRAENLQTVPIAVTAISGSTLESRAAVSLQSLQATVPNVQINNFSNTPQTAVFAIRGIGVIDPDPYAGNTVSIVYDGIPQFFSYGALLDLYDIDRVEILRGPQGTLFGANTTGGVVNVATRQPTGQWGGRGEITYGNYNRFDISAALDAPLVQNILAGKLVVSHTQSDGYTTNVFNGKDMGSKDHTLVRGYLKLTPTPNFDATLVGEYVRVRDGAPIFINGSVPGEAQFVPPGVTPNGATIPMYTSPCVPAGQPCHAPDHYYSGNNSVPDTSNMNNYRATLTMNLRDTPIGDITSITGYRDFRLFEFTDQDGSAAFLSDTRRLTKGWQFSQELRTSARVTKWWNLIGGGFYLKDHYTLAQDYRLQFAAPGLLQIGNQNQDNYSASAFLQNYFQITDTLRAQAGIRYSHERTSMLASTITSIALDGMTDFDGTGNVPVSAVAPPRGAKSWNNVGWKLGLDYTVRPGLLLYGYWARGFKSGVFTGRIGLPSDLGPAAPEHVDTFEGGIKADLFDRHLRINLAGFYTNYRDIQLSTIYFQTNGSQTIQGNSIINAASAHIKGFELESSVLPFRGLTLTGSLSYLDAKYKKFEYFNSNAQLDANGSPVLDANGNVVPIGFQDLSGSRLQNAPKWTATAGATYETDVGPGKLLLHALYSYNSSRYMYALNDTPRALIQPVNLVDANIDYTWRNYTLSFWGTNLFDKRYISSVYDAPGVEGLAAYMPPRRYGVAVKANF
jgi:iron complex outermembrane receptor protein